MKYIILTKVLFLYFINNIVCQPTTDERHRMANYYGNLQHEMIHQQYPCPQEIELQKIGIQNLTNNFTNQIRTVQQKNRDNIDQMTNNYTLEIANLKGILLNQNKTLVAVLKEISNNQSLANEPEKGSKNSIEHMIKNYTLEITSLKETLLEQKKRIDTLEEISSHQSMLIGILTDKDKNNPVYQDCSMFYKSGYTTNGVYTIHVNSIEHPVLVYCDMQLGGGWTVFQSRLHGNVSFKQPWSAYKLGFGNVTGDFWLGNDIIAAMTGYGKSGYKLRVDLTKFSGDSGFAEYENFKIGNERENYKLTVGHYTGTTGDNGKGLSNNNNYLFTTFDQDNDGHSINCANPNNYGGGWWYTPSCGYVNLNGPYLNSRRRSDGDDIFWHAFDGFYSLMKTEMKFRPMDF